MRFIQFLLSLILLAWLLVVAWPLFLVLAIILAVTWVRFYVRVKRMHKQAFDQFQQDNTFESKGLDSSDIIDAEYKEKDVTDEKL